MTIMFETLYNIKMDESDEKIRTKPMLAEKARAAG